MPFADVPADTLIVFRVLDRKIDRLNEFGPMQPPPHTKQVREKLRRLKADYHGVAYKAVNVATSALPPPLNLLQPGVQWRNLQCNPKTWITG